MDERQEYSASNPEIDFEVQDTEIVFARETGKKQTHMQVDFRNKLICRPVVYPVDACR